MCWEFDLPLGWHIVYEWLLLLPHEAAGANACLLPQAIVCMLWLALELAAQKDREVNLGIILGDRAAALKERGWVGDAMYAVRDCERALRLDPSSQLAKITRAHALLDMDQLEVPSSQGRRPTSLLSHVNCAVAKCSGASL